MKKFNAFLLSAVGSFVLGGMFAAITMDKPGIVIGVMSCLASSTADFCVTINKRLKAGSDGDWGKHAYLIAGFSTGVITDIILSACGVNTGAYEKNVGLIYIPVLMGGFWGMFCAGRLEPYRSSRPCQKVREVPHSHDYD